MTRQEKANIIEELSAKFQQNSHFYITDASGLSVAKVNALRRLCYDRGVEYGVYKNTLVKKALENVEGDFTVLSDTALKGFTGIMFTSEVGNLPAKLIKEYRKKQDQKKPVLKAASIESEVYIGEEHLAMLAELKSKPELIADVIMLLQSPAKNVVSALLSGRNKLAGIVQTLSERNE